MTSTTTPAAASHDGVPLPRLSDQAAVELYLFVEQLFLIIESRYAAQIRRHFDDLDQYSLFDPDDSPADDLPF